ncbi:hypothetical protein [Nodularia spumigena]|uniref:Uncharacterized protein n=1 Tax=Nodularia spumigena UHCC 0060 TaxID=3110300 RepID=A0ABU5UMQ5_NODSP|nr:hypothetical protein [Nodularia spumigena]MEA5523449.1 hypothetical protein [Nodularia spumigena UHCC 0143]MEA5607372.1 hypothetical protein [Nodularia spumigena UHCC 0060]
MKFPNADIKQKFRLPNLEETVTPPTAESDPSSAPSSPVILTVVLIIAV